MGGCEGGGRHCAAAAFPRQQLTRLQVLRHGAPSGNPTPVANKHTRVSCSAGDMPAVPAAWVSRLAHFSFSAACSFCSSLHRVALIFRSCHTQIPRPQATCDSVADSKLLLLPTTMHRASTPCGTALVARIRRASLRPVQAGRRAGGSPRMPGSSSHTHTRTRATLPPCSSSACRRGVRRPLAQCQLPCAPPCAPRHPSSAAPTSPARPASRWTRFIQGWSTQSALAALCQHCLAIALPTQLCSGLLCSRGRNAAKRCQQAGRHSP